MLEYKRETPEPSIILNVEPRLGMSITDVAESAIHIAKTLNVVVRLKFNDRILHATPRKTSSDLCCEYHTPRPQENKKEFKKNED